MAAGRTDAGRGHRQGTIRGGRSAGADRRRATGLALATAASLVLAGCGATESTISKTVKPVTDKVGFSTDVPPPKDFVQQSRPANMDYLAVGVTPPARSTKVLTPKELETATGDLEATRVAHDKLSGRPPPPPPGAPAAKKGGAKPPAKASTKKQGENAPASQ